MFFECELFVSCRVICWDLVFVDSYLCWGGFLSDLVVFILVFCVFESNFNKFISLVIRNYFVGFVIGVIFGMKRFFLCFVRKNYIIVIIIVIIFIVFYFVIFF